MIVNENLVLCNYFLDLVVGWKTLKRTPKFYTIRAELLRSFPGKSGKRKAPSSFLTYLEEIEVTVPRVQVLIPQVFFTKTCNTQKGHSPFLSAFR